MKDFPVFLKRISEHWIFLLTSNGIIALFGTYEHYYGTAISWNYFGTYAAISLFIACFMSWKKEYYLRTNLESLFEERSRPKLRIEYAGSMTRPEYQAENDLYRLAIINDSDTPVSGAQVVIESAESDAADSFYPEHGLRVMGVRNDSPRFDIAARSRIWVDLAQRIFVTQTNNENVLTPVLTFAVLHHLRIPEGRHVYTLRAEGSGQPFRARIVVTVANNTLSVSDLQPI